MPTDAHGQESWPALSHPSHPLLFTLYLGAHHAIGYLGKSPCFKKGHPKIKRARLEVESGPFFSGSGSLHVHVFRPDNGSGRRLDRLVTSSPLLPGSKPTPCFQTGPLKGIKGCSSLPQKAPGTNRISFLRYLSAVFVGTNTMHAD